MKHLSWTQRKSIYYGIKAGKSNAQIAREIGVHRSTVGREIVRNARRREDYHPLEASDRSWLLQKLAMRDRFPLRAKSGGVKQFTRLKRHENRIYTYLSQTHDNICVRQDYYLPKLQYWNSAYIRRQEKKRFRAERFYFSSRIYKKQWTFCFSKDRLPVSSNTFKVSGVATESRLALRKSFAQSGRKNLSSSSGLERDNVPGLSIFFTKRLEQGVRNRRKTYFSLLNSGRCLSKQQDFSALYNVRENFGDHEVMDSQNSFAFRQIDTKKILLNVLSRVLCFADALIFMFNKRSLRFSRMNLSMSFYIFLASFV